MVRSFPRLAGPRLTMMTTSQRVTVTSNRDQNITRIKKPVQLRSVSSDGLSVESVLVISIGTKIVVACAPTLRNMHLSSVKSVENIAKFRRRLTLYLYSLAYPALLSGV